MDINKNVISSSTMSNAIPIFSKKKIESVPFIDQYDLKINCFDPDKASPPNSWTSRLLERIENFSERSIDIKMNNFNFYK